MNMRVRQHLRYGMAFAVAVSYSVFGGSMSWGNTVNVGRLDVIGPEGQVQATCPLEHTDVVADISGFITRVTLKQTFTNPYEEPIEAVYVFPLSDRGAVDRMSMKIGERTIRGTVKERDEARRIYESARNAGQRASLLDQERPNIFTQSVANILPGENVEITISYVEYLKYEEGEYEFSFPMVVGPRYIPGGINEGPAIPDAHRITPPMTPEGTRAGHDISLTVNLDAGLPLQELKSDLHQVKIVRITGNKARIVLTNQKEIPNRDFVLRYRVAGDDLEDAILTHADSKGGFFSLILQPPARVASDTITPKEMIFVIDRSGSMSGFPIEKAKKAMRMCIEQMNPGDTFNLVSFAGGTGYCFEKSVQNTRENRSFALAYLEQLRGRGGTEMMPAINAVLGAPNDPERLRVVCFMTDGYIGNDMAILDAIRKNAGTARVFSFGIGNSVNRFLIEGMAREGRGASEIITLESQGDEAAKRFHDRIHSPLLTDITVDFGGLDVQQVLPTVNGIPDLFAAQPLILTGRYGDAGEGYITVRGNTVNGPWQKRIKVLLPEREEAHDVLAPLWARQQIASLMADDWMGAQHGSPMKDIKAKITDLGVDFSLVTQYTSFIAVEEMIVNEGGKTRRVDVPIEMADGVSYEGVYGARNSNLRHNFTKNKRVATAFYNVGAVPRPPSKAIYLGQEVRRLRGLESPALLKLDAEPLYRISVEIADELRESDDAENEVKDKKRLDASKLHPSLQGLHEKNESLGSLKLVGGKLEVFIRLSDDSIESLRALKKAGVQIVSHARSAKTVLARIAIKDLQKVIKLDFVTYIGPATY